MRRSDATRGANCQSRGILDKTADLYEIEEDGWVDGMRARSVVVGIRKSLKDLWRYL
jgi:hypothetical protein